MTSLMDRRAFVRMLAAAASARGAASFNRAATPRSQAAQLPTLKVVSRYGRSSSPGMPGPYPGRVVSVASAASVDISTGAANAEAVGEMMARGMRALTGAET